MPIFLTSCRQPAGKEWSIRSRVCSHAIPKEGQRIWIDKRLRAIFVAVEFLAGQA
jgi:hypothetical protein